MSANRHMSAPMTWQEHYLERFYNPARGFVNGTKEFHALCATAGRGAAEILEIGAGPSNPTSRFLATLGRLQGLDVDPDALDNDALASAETLVGSRFPYPDGTFDLCVSNYVGEHIRDPQEHLREVHRVLRPNGAYVFRTPNRYHYVAAIASLTPHWFHERTANALRKLPQDSHAPYPSFYRMNSRRAIRDLASATGFEIETMRLVEKEPSYGMASRAMFLAFTAYERAVNATELLANARANLFVVLRAR
jgi:SAM-dependent methyltransferase